MADKRFVDDFNSIVKQKITAASLLKPETPVAIPQTIGTGKPANVPSNASSISSPLTETAYKDRSWYGWVTSLSSDGLFAMKTRRIKEIKMVDAGSRSVIFDYQDKL